MLKSSPDIIPVSEPLIGENVLPLLRECIETGWISSEGRFLREFEQKWAAYCGVEHGVAVSSGTAALQVAMASLDLPPGSEVIMPTFTIISCAIAILESNCVPVLVDCEPDAWCLNVDEVEARINPRTRAVMPVHVFGHPADMRRLSEVARKHDLFIIEDAAESHGAEVDSRRVGGLGTLGCFSFYANKIITTGEGGMVVTNSAKFADRMRSLRNLAFGTERRFLHTEIGHNYRMTNMQAAIGLAQLEHIKAHIDKKRWIARCYRERLADIDRITVAVEKDWAYSVYWMFGVVLDDDVPFDAEGFACRLSQEGIETRPFFLGMHEQPALRSRGLFRAERYHVCERLSRRGLYLPSGLTLKEEQIDRVATAIRRVLS